MKPTIEQIDATIDVINGDWLNEQINGEHTINYVGFMNAVSESYETILFALRFTKKMMGEPNDMMCHGGDMARRRARDEAKEMRIPQMIWHEHREFFKEMVRQAIKEVEDEN